MRGGGFQLCTSSVYSGCVQMMCVCVSMCVRWVPILVTNHAILNNTYSWVKPTMVTCFPPGMYYIIPQFEGRNFSPVRTAATMSKI